MKFNYTIILLFFAGQVSAQIDSISSSTHIFWNEEYPILMSHFIDTSNVEANINNCDSLQLCWGACIGLWAIIDEPKKKRKRGKLIEQEYFVPAFELAKSYRLNNDTIDYFTQLLIFDVHELIARKCRKDVEYFFNEMPYYGTKLLMFKKVENENTETLKGIVSSITNDIYVEKKENAYEEWRNTISDLLDESMKYKTTSTDRIRFIKNKPILKGYQMAEKV